VVVDYVGGCLAPLRGLHRFTSAGRFNRVAADATAYPHRDVEFVMNLHTRWTDPAQDKTCIGWTRELFDKAASGATGGVYVNFMPEDEEGRIKERCLRPELRAAGHHQGQVRPGQPVPVEPEHPAGGVTADRTAGANVREPGLKPALAPT